MKFTLGWLKEHLDTEASLDEISDTLTMTGLEVEEIKDQGEGLRDFVVARIIEANPHPDADRLRVCKIDTGTGVENVVCGAPNARAGLLGVFAATGSFIPGSNITLKKAKIRGVESSGMMLSAKEMGLGEDHDGIIELSGDAPLGSPAVAAMGLGDPVIDIAITPNRGDCLGVRGIARDLAAAGIGKLKPLDTASVPGSFDSPIKVRLDFAEDAASACPHFVGRLIRGVSNVESPEWLKRRLEAVGLRPISALVDITNYMSLDLCRPLHVFDADKVSGDLQVRLSKSGERLMALDGAEYTLDADMTVICDDHAALALGGVIGGEGSGCTAETKDVFVESALFDPIRTAATGRKLNIISDARFRFERGIDTDFLVDGMEIATRMILDICGGEASLPVITGAPPERTSAVSFRPERIKTLGGMNVSRDEARTILDRLGFEVVGEGEPWDVIAPSWRNDIVGEADLVEEVMRIKGYDSIETAPLPGCGEASRPALSATQARRVQARRLLASRGMVEAVTLSFMASKDTASFGGVSEALRLTNPISSDLDAMRPSIMPNLITACGRNQDRGIADGALFEIGPQFSGDEPDQQVMVAAGLRMGAAQERHWTGGERALDVFDAKADVLALLSFLGVSQASLQTKAPGFSWYHPGRSGLFTQGPKNVLAVFGEVHPGVSEKMGLRGAAAAFEVFLDNIPGVKAKKKTARSHLELSSFQPVERDFAFIVDAEVTAETLLSAALKADGLIDDVRLFDVFSGSGVKDGKKSLAINVRLQPMEATLRDEEIEAVSENVVKAVAKATGGTLRT
jgi:phenylalanyl-tRNA synthetase beta chain